MSDINGATAMARSLKQQGVDTMFGVVGFPVIPLALAAQREGIQYFGFRNEQSASYAAGAVGYLTARGELHSCVVIRAAVVQAGTAQVRRGCGVVYDSRPSAEALEARRKAEALLEAPRPPGSRA